MIPEQPKELLRIARESIDAHLNGKNYTPLPLSPPFNEPKGIFVTLWGGKQNNELRGCIGHIYPEHKLLSDEISECAVLAATMDNRFAPVSPEELEELDIEISILGIPFPITDLKSQNPKIHGLIVSKGYRKGLLLPDIEGVDNGEVQLKICKQKAGIDQNAEVKLERFEVVKISETKALRG